MVKLIDKSNRAAFLLPSSLSMGQKIKAYLLGRFF
jgi:hypothetical protein